MTFINAIPIIIFLLNNTILNKISQKNMRKAGFRNQPFNNYIYNYL